MTPEELADLMIEKSVDRAETLVKFGAVVQGMSRPMTEIEKLWVDVGIMAGYVGTLEALRELGMIAGVDPL